MVKRFLASGRTGFYVAVSQEGDVGAGDDITVLSREANAVPVSEVTRLYVAKAYRPDDVASVRREWLNVARTELCGSSGISSAICFRISCR